MKHAAITFLQMLYPDGPWCLSAATPERDKLTTKTFTNAESALTWIKGWNGERNLYYHVNPPRDEHASNKLKRTDVLGVFYFHVDVDPSATGETAGEDFRKAALGLVRNPPKPLPSPTFVIYTGGGFQALWKLRDPIDLDGTMEAAESAKLYNLEIERLFKENGGALCKTDNVHNIDRLLRLPGTLNVPSALKISRGRSSTPVEAKLVIHQADNIYELSAFKAGSPVKKTIDDAAGPTASKGGSAGDVAVGSHPPVEHLSFLDQWNVPTRVKTVLAMGRDADRPKKGDDSRSAWLFDVIGNLIRHAVPDAVIYALVTDNRWQIAESVLDKKDPHGYAVRQIEKAHGSAKTGEHSNRAGAAKAQGARAVPVPPDGDDFHYDKHGIPYPTLHNVRHALHMLGVSLRYDLFADRAVIQHGDSEPKILQDHDVLRLWLEIEEKFRFSYGKDKFWGVVEDQARRNSYHPVCEYLDGLTWDGTPRLQTWLIDYAGAVDNAYVRAVSELFLVAGVRRVREPGALFQEMLVLISPEQGKGKSTALGALCPHRAWFLEDMPLGADSKTVMERLSGRWIVECAELKGLRNSDVEHLKSFLSRLSETARMAYGRMVKEQLRQCIMFGTTNAIRFLRDTTGNRRFWPIRVWKEISKEAIIQVREQLWAEASHLEKTWGEVRLPRHLWDMAGDAQEEVRLDDPYVDILREHLGELGGRIKSNDVWTILGIPPAQRSTQSQQMGEAMRIIGWERKNVRFGGKEKEAGYVRGDSEQQLEVFRDQAGRVTVSVKGENQYDEPAARNF